MSTEYFCVTQSSWEPPVLYHNMSGYFAESDVQGKISTEKITPIFMILAVA